MAAHRQSTERRHYAPEVRIGACADYLLGKSYQEIEGKWNIKDMSTVLNWIRKTGSFKLRNKHSVVSSPSTLPGDERK
jgi:hypothetical protein